MTDYFGISDRIKTLTAPAGLEDVHQDGFSWAKQGTTWETTTRWNAADLNMQLAQWRGLFTIDGVDLSDLPADSPFILKEALLRSLPAAVIAQADVVGAQAAAVLGDDVTFQGLVAAAAGAPNQQIVAGTELVQSKTYVPGGLKRFSATPVTGALRVKLPLAVADTGLFVMFWLDCYNYAPQASCSFLISAYIYNGGTPSWISPTVRQIGGAVRHPVTFGNDGVNLCVQIGDTTYAWGYPMFRVRDIVGNTGAKWTTLNATPWVMSIETAALTSVFATVYDGRDNGGSDVNGAATDATTDANTHVKWGGFFNKLLTNGAANIPAADTWAIEYHRQNDIYGTQVAWPAYGNTLAPAIRRNNNGTWGAWKSLAWADDYVPKTGGTYSGALTVTTSLLVQPASGGRIQLVAGDATHTGIASFFNAAATRLAYIGWATDAGKLMFTAENGLTGFSFNAAVDATSFAASSTMTRAGYTVRDAGNTPDGTQALAQAGTDTSQRTWRATDLKDAAQAWATAAAFAIVADQKASGTGGGAFAAGAWQTRTLNTEVKDPLNRITLSANTFVSTVNAEVEWFAPAYQVASHLTRLYNVTDGAVVAYGSSGRAGVSADTNTLSTGRADIVAGKTYRLEHYCGGTSVSGFGFQSSQGTETYATVNFYSR